MTTDNKKVVPTYMKFILGGIAGMGACSCVQPLDLLKNRMQMKGVGVSPSVKQSSIQVFASIIRNEGFFAIYSGLSAGLLRQATYSTTRLGTFTNLSEYFNTKKQRAPNIFEKLIISMFSGICGAFVGTPAEVCLIRMTSDGRLPPAERRNYKSVIDAILRISREEGFTTLWRGAIPTMGRAAVVNGAQLTTYSQVKQKILEKELIADGVLLHFVSSMISGFVTSAVSMPLDIAKTRIQNMRFVDGKPEYRNMGDVLMRLVKNEGISALWKGFTPYYFRIGPHTVITFIFLEQLNRLYIERIL